jgi:predicted RecA/RadA family phage recombinase
MRRTLLLFLLLLVIAIPQTGFVQNVGYSGGSHGGSTDLTSPGPIGGTAPSTINTTDQYFYASGVSHGMTSIAGTHDYGAVFFMNSALGGLDLYGMTDADSDGSLRLTGIIGSTNPTDSYAAVHIRGGKKNGTGWQALGNAETIVEFYNYTTKVGRAYGNGEWILTSLQNTPIGSTIASTGNFTTLTAVNNSLNMAPAADAFSGTTVSAVAASAVSVGHLCYINSSGQMAKADVDSAITMPGMYISAAVISAGSTGVYLRDGIIHLHTLATSWSSVGFPVYAGSGATTAHTAGAISQGVPTGSGDQVQVIGIALGADILDFRPSPVIVEVQ